MAEFSRSVGLCPAQGTTGVVGEAEEARSGSYALRGWGSRTAARSGATRYEGKLHLTICSGASSVSYEPDAFSAVQFPGTYDVLSP